MEKLMKSSVARIFAGILLAIMIEITFLSGVLTIGIYLNCGYIPSGKSEAKKQIVQNITWDYLEDISAYYRAVLDNEKYVVMEYQNSLDSENCNLSFTVEPIKDDFNQEYYDELPILNNFELESKQYQGVFERYVVYDEKDFYTNTPLSTKQALSCIASANKANIIVYDDADTENDENIYSYEYTDLIVSYGDEIESGIGADGMYLDDGKFYTREELYNFGYTDKFIDSYSYITNNDLGYGTYSLDGATLYHYGPLTANEDINYSFTEIYGLPQIYVTDIFNEDGALGIYIPELNETYYFETYSYVYNNILRKHEYLTKRYNSINYYTYYDPESGIVVDYECGKELGFVVTVEVAKNLTAHDRYMNSWTLWLVDHFYGISIPILILAAILSIALSVFVIVSAGHRKDTDEIVLTAFDKIPIDILILIPVLLLQFIFERYMYDSYYIYSRMVGYISNRLIGIGLIGFALLFVPIYLKTIAARSKAGTILSNTVIVRLIKLVFKFIRFIGGAIAHTSVYLVKNVNIYIKYIVGFFGISFVIWFITIMYDGCIIGEGMWLGAMALIWLGLLILLIKGLVDMSKLKKGGIELAAGNNDYKINTEKMSWEFKKHAEQLNAIGDGIQTAVDERMKSERMKTELITNVSHDIKTPLTSIINYVDLLQKEDIQNEKATEYLKVLERQSARLKKLIEDLIDASKASTGNMKVTLEDVDVEIMLGQAMGEFEDKLSRRNLKVVQNLKAENMMVVADGKLLWRVIANLFSNVSKYSVDSSRVYIDTKNVGENKLEIVMKNISKEEINVSGDELLERFVRGDSSRNTEGSGLGLSIAKSLMELMGGDLSIVVDGDLFKVILILSVCVAN